MKKIPVFYRSFDNKDLSYVSSAIKNNWISSNGSFSKKFEIKFSKLIKHKYVSMVSSGTSALECAMAALNLQKGDEVILPNFTIISCLNAILKFDAKPVILDVCKDTWLLDTKKILQAVNSKTKAILIVNIFGNSFNVKELKLKLKNKKVTIIEDCAESLCSYNNGLISGSVSDISIFSLFSNKLITCGEGGVICTSNKNYINRINNYKNLFFGKKERFNHSEIGYNYRLSDLQAAMAYSSLLKINSNIKNINRVGNLYKKYLSKNDRIIFQKENDNSKKLWWMYPIIFKNINNNIKKIRNHLSKNYIDSRNLFKPLDTMPFLKKIKHKTYGNKNSMFLYKNGLYLPSSYSLTESQIKYISNVINEYIS